MKLALLALALVLAVPARAAKNELFAYPHMLPSPFTLKSGRIVIGADLSYGLTDFATIGTNIVSDINKVYNAHLKLSMFDFEAFAFALTGGVSRYNLRDISSKNPDITITSWRPGAVASFALGSDFALFTGGSLLFANIQPSTDTLETSGYAQGAVAEADLAWSYASDSKRKHVSNALATGVSYDFTYKLVGMGLSHSWPSFKLGFHFYPAATRDKVVPIIAFGAVIDL